MSGFRRPNQPCALSRHVESKRLCYFVVHLKLGAYFEVGYFSASKGVEHITDEISYHYHAPEVIGVLDHGRLPPVLAMILECSEVQSCGDFFTDMKPHYCVKTYDYFKKGTAEQARVKWKVVQWVREEDLPSHLDLYPDHLPILKDEPDMGEDESAFAMSLMTKPWYQRCMYFRQRQVTRKQEGRLDDGNLLSDLYIAREAKAKREEAVERLASTRRVAMRQQNLLGSDSSSQVAVTRDLMCEFPIQIPDPPSQDTPNEWPKEFVIEPVVELELLTHPPNRCQSKLRLVVTRRLPDQTLFGRFSSESLGQGGDAGSTFAEYGSRLGTRASDIDHFLRQYTELVTDRGRCPAQVTLTYAGQPPTVYKEYPFFFSNRKGDDCLDLPCLTRLALGPVPPVADEKLASQRSVG